MLNEKEEFLSYTGVPVYSSASKQDYSYLGRIAFATILDFEGLPRIFSIIARGYMYGVGEPNTNRARKALCAGAVSPIKKKMPPAKSGSIKVIFVSCTVNFPSL